MRRTRILPGLAGIILCSFTAGILGLGLYNSGKFAAMASSTVSVAQSDIHFETPELLPELPLQSSRSTPVATVAGRGTSSADSNPGSRYKPGSNYLQSASEPEKRVVYQQEPPRDTSRQDKLEVYRSLQETCQRWTQWYNKDRSSHSAVQMNVACREAAEYGRKELNLNISAKRVNPDSRQKKTKSGGEVIFIENPRNNESPRCQSLRRELENIQSRLRAGYSAREGERLKKRRRVIREEMQQRC